MAGRIDYAVSVSAIQTNSAFEGVTQEAVESNIGRSLGGGNSSTTWAGASQLGWSSGTNVHKDSGGGTIVVASGDDGLWIKHTGFDFVAASPHLGTTANTALVTVTGGSVRICNLKAGEAIFIPQPMNQTITLSDDGTSAAVEYAVLS